MATFAEPHRYASGIRHLVINGAITIQNGRHTGALGGRVLRKT
jgi:N-acyl-D-amino-acid deacylase